MLWRIALASSPASGLFPGAMLIVRIARAPARTRDCDQTPCRFSPTARIVAHVLANHVTAFLPRVRQALGRRLSSKRRLSLSAFSAPFVSRNSQIDLD